MKIYISKWTTMSAVFVCLILCSCGSGSNAALLSEHGGEEIILETIDPEPLYSQIDSVWHVQLETTDSSLISYIAGMEVMDDRYYILNGTYTSILIFDRQGKLIRGIYDQGKGPKEYVRICTMKLDRVNKQIVVSDQFLKKLLIYDRDGRWVKTIPFELCWAPIAPFLGDQYIQVNDGRENVLPEELKAWNLTVFDNTGKIQTNRFPNQTPNRMDFTTTQTVQVLDNGQILFMPLLSSIIYQVGADSILPAYRLVNKLGEHKSLSKADLNKIEYKFGDKNSTWDEYERKNYLCYPGMFLNSSQMLFVTIGGDASRYYIFSDKQTGQTRIFDCTNKSLPDLAHLTADQALRELFNTSPLCIENDKFYIELNHVHKLFLQGKEIDPRFRALCDALGDNDNPLIVRYKIKTRGKE